VSEATDQTAILSALIRGDDLSAEASAAAMHAVMSGALPPVRVAALLIALRAKGETAEEIAGFARIMREFALPVRAPAGAVDTCGTGGDGAGTFNISTVAALVVAAAGAPVVKHGNRAASGRCGSADLLEAWGVAIDLPPEGVEASVAECGIGFCFAPTFHPAMRHAMPARRELGVPTVFNFLGPLTNPGHVRHQTIGVSNPGMAAKMAGVLALLGVDHALVFHAEDGLDELTTTAPSTVWEVRGSEVEQWRFDPADLDLAPAGLDDLRGGDIAENRAIAEDVLAGKPGPARDVVALAAGAALYAADRAGSVAEGMEAAQSAIVAGAAEKLLERWIQVSQALADSR
jgi:anthranilate phosphoribosyltransferase